MYFVYILQSEKDNQLYVGMTSNVERRLKQHNDGGVRSTSKRRPFKVIYKEPYSSRVEAREREKFLKSYKGAKEKLEIVERASRALSSIG